MNPDEAAAYCRAGDWTAIEARFQRAKQALLETQQRHCDAAQEFLLARAEVRQMLEMIFPGVEAASSPTISEACCGGKAAVLHNDSVPPAHSPEIAAGQRCMGARP